MTTQTNANREPFFKLKAGDVFLLKGDAYKVIELKPANKPNHTLITLRQWIKTEKAWSLPIIDCELTI